VVAVDNADQPQGSSRRGRSGDADRTALHLRILERTF
jgi:hypothetical protein